MRIMLLIIGMLATSGVGCFRHSGQGLRIGEQVDLPQGLDSVAAAKWIAQQRATCPGQLRFLTDQMPRVSLDGTPVPYRSPIVAVVCARP